MGNLFLSTNELDYKSAVTMGLIMMSVRVLTPAEQNVRQFNDPKASRLKWVHRRWSSSFLLLYFVTPASFGPAAFVYQNAVNRL